MENQLAHAITQTEYDSSYDKAAKKLLANKQILAQIMKNCVNEYGEGRSDVVVYDSINARVAIFEAKYTKVLENLESECDIALQQIDDRMYAKEYEDDYDQILCYRISFFKKRCMVKKK